MFTAPASETLPMFSSGTPMARSAYQSPLKSVGACGSSGSAAGTANALDALVSAIPTIKTPTNRECFFMAASLSGMQTGAGFNVGAAVMGLVVDAKV